MLPRENQLIGCALPNAAQGSVPAGQTLKSGFNFCFQFQGCSSLVLRRPSEPAAFIGQVKYVQVVRRTKLFDSSKRLRLKLATSLDKVAGFRDI